MSTQENKDLVRRFVEDACNGRRLELLPELFVQDYVHHDPQLPPQAQRGLDNYTQGIRGMFAAFPDLQATLEDVISDGDRVVTRMTWTGTHTGGLFGIPPTGKPVSFPLIEIQRIEGGKIAEGWAVYDALGMMQQIGVVPTPESAGV